MMSESERLRMASDAARSLMAHFEPVKRVDRVHSVPRKRLDRNEPCDCGSGRKYKHCCLGV